MKDDQTYWIRAQHLFALISNGFSCTRCVFSTWLGRGLQALWSTGRSHTLLESCTVGFDLRSTVVLFAGAGTDEPFAIWP